MATLSNVIIPELFDPYVINRTVELSALFQSGIVQRSPKFDQLASEAAPTHHMPFWEDLTGDSEQIVEGVDLTPKQISSNQDISATFRRASMWYASDLDAAMSGSDPMRAIGDLVAGFWARDMQKELLAILKGIFASTAAGALSKTNQLDISGGTGDAANFTASSFVDAQQLLGDNQAVLTAIVMHSATRASLYKQNQIEVIRPSESPAFETYQGKRVIVDDGMPVSNGVYTSYLFGSGAIAYGDGSPVGFVRTEVDRDKRKGSGLDYLINRRTSILHPRGIKWTNTTVAKVEGPSRAEMALAANWQRVYEPKQIRIVEFKHKLK